MPFQKVEFEFPETDEDGSTEIEIESSDEVEVDFSGDTNTPEPESEAEPEIEVVNDVPEKDRGRVPSEPPEDITKEELNNYSEKVARRIQHFSKGYHDERRAKETAQRERDELQSAVQGVLAEKDALQDTVNKNQQALFQQAKHSVAGELSQAKEAFKVAHDSGDSEALLNAQERFTNAKLKAGRLEEFEEPREIVDTTSRRQPNPPPVDHKAEAWRDNNTWFGNSSYAPETAFAVGLHKQLVAEDNITVSSDEYYEAINSRMRSTFPQLYGEFDEQEVETPKSRVRDNNVVAPATRSTGPKKYRMTQTQLNLSKRLGLTPAQYAKQAALEVMRNKNG